SRLRAPPMRATAPPGLRTLWFSGTAASGRKARNAEPTPTTSTSPPSRAIAASPPSSAATTARPPRSPASSAAPRPSATTRAPAETDGERCPGVPGCGNRSTVPMPADPAVTDAGVAQAAGAFALFNGTINGISGYTVDGAYDGTSQTSITVTFTANAPNPV